MYKFDEGAEATTYLDELFGVEVIIKIRAEKRYRVVELDEKLRIFRTKREAKILAILQKAMLPVPELIAVGKYTIIMKKLDGVLLRDIDQKITFMKDIGKVVKKMHENGVVHGDLTPANIMIKENKPSIIDFGLGEITKSPEERAIDILLFKRSLNKKEFSAFLQAYSENNKDYSNTLIKLQEIEKRGRYQIRTLI